MNDQTKKNIFLIECSAPHWIDVAKQLESNHIQVCYWSGWSRIKTEVSVQFKHAIFHDTYYAKIGFDPEGQRYHFFEFDEICKQVWRNDAQIVYDMMNRFDYSRDQTMIERSLLFSEHLCYWRHILKKYNPDLVLFSTPPHVVYDYILLALCRNLNIQTLMYEEATIYPPYCLVMEDYLDGSIRLRTEARKNHDISEKTKAIIAKLKGAYREAKPIREIIAHDAMDKAVSAGLRGVTERANTIKKIDEAHQGLYTVNEKIVNLSSVYKQKGVPLRQSFSQAFANSQYSDQLIEEFNFTNELRNYYYNHVTPLEKIVEPLVYVALAGQPERTSNPQAGIFANQLLMVNMIAHALPEGWVVAVREHPNQFHPEFAVNMCRSKEYYDSLLALPSVRILSTQCDPFDIIDCCQFVVTSGGTTALEGVARGKPALLFGDAWYKDCPGVHRVNSIDEIRLLFQKSPKDLGCDSRSFANFVESITKGCFRGLADYPPADYPVEKEENVNNLAKSILEVMK